MDLLNTAENIINAKFNECSCPLHGTPMYNEITPISQLTEALNKYVAANADTDALLSIHITEDELADFVSTPLGKLWAIMAIPLSTGNAPFILDSIRDLRRILSQIKTLTDAHVIRSNSMSQKNDKPDE